MRPGDGERWAAFFDGEGATKTFLLLIQNKVR